VEEGARRRCGPAVLVEEMEIGFLCELLWVMAMLLMHWIGVWGSWWWLSTMTRDGGGGRVKGGDRSRRN
jgi:hypothetical protein